MWHTDRIAAVIPCAVIPHAEVVVEWLNVVTIIIAELHSNVEGVLDQINPQISNKHARFNEIENHLI